jgi:hypothetical protein
MPDCLLLLQVDAKGAHMVAMAVGAKSSSLLRLNLRENELEDKGAVLVAAAVAKASAVVVGVVVKASVCVCSEVVKAGVGV